MGHFLSLTLVLLFPQLWQTSRDWIYFKAPSVISLRSLWFWLSDNFWSFSKFEHKVLSSCLCGIVIGNIHWKGHIFYSRTFCKGLEVILIFEFSYWPFLLAFFLSKWKIHITRCLTYLKIGNTTKVSDRKFHVGTTLSTSLLNVQQKFMDFKAWYMKETWYYKLT